MLVSPYHISRTYKLTSIIYTLTIYVPTASQKTQLAKEIIIEYPGAKDNTPGLKDMYVLRDKNRPVCGVKGISVIDILPAFDTVHVFTPEYMHSLCQGVIRKVCNLWRDSKNHVEEYYLGRSVEKLDKRLLAISLPSPTLNQRKKVLEGIRVESIHAL